MNKEEFKLSDKELHKAIDNLKGTKFLDAFCILDWIIKTKDENEQLQQKVNQLEMSIATKDSELLQLKEELLQLKTNRDEAIKELFILKDMIYKPETREENFEIQRKISSILIELERGKE